MLKHLECSDSFAIHHAYENIYLKFSYSSSHSFFTFHPFLQLKKISFFTRFRPEPSFVVITVPNDSLQEFLNWTMATLYILCCFYWRRSQTVIYTCIWFACRINNYSFTFATTPPQKHEEFVVCCQYLNLILFYFSLCVSLEPAATVYLALLILCRNISSAYRLCKRQAPAAVRVFIWMRTMWYSLIQVWNFYYNNVVRL